MESNLVDFSQTFLSLKEQNQNMVVVTLTNVKGSVPQVIGARMIVSDSGILFGTVGGGKIEKKCLDVAKELLKQTKIVAPQSFTWNLQRDIGMTCGGETSFLFEVYNQASAWNIVIFGAGHISQALTRILLSLNCQLTVIDNRREWLDLLPKENLKLKKVLSEKMEDEVSKIDESSFVISITMGHKKDVPILYKALSERNFPYLGAVGSLSKRNRMEKELIELGIEKKKISSLICPIGEKLGNNSPGEIAISISAQLLRVRDDIVSLEDASSFP